MLIFANSDLYIYIYTQGVITIITLAPFILILLLPVWNAPHFLPKKIIQTEGQGLR